MDYEWDTGKKVVLYTVLVIVDISVLNVCIPSKNMVGVGTDQMNFFSLTISINVF